MRRLIISAFALAGISGSPAAAQGVPEAIKARVNELVAQCARAGGQLGQMTGQGQFVIPRDFNGDGRTDFLVSEGNFPCTGRPTLFRPDGLAKVQLYVADGAGGATLAFEDRLLAYRVLDGRPAKLQIARRGPACGASRCSDELRWNAAANRFDEHATDGRNVAIRAAAGAAPVNAPVMTTATASAEPKGSPAAPAGNIPAVQAGAETKYKAACRSRYLAGKPPRTDWIDSACADEWKVIAASQPLAELLLRAVPGGQGGAPALNDLRQRLVGVRWAARPEQGHLATGQSAGYQIGIIGRSRPETVSINWSKIGAELPLDIQAAIAARGATMTLTRCEKHGPGEGERAWSVAFPGQPPFELMVSQRMAPTGGAWSFYSAQARVDGAPAGKGPTRCEQFW